MNKQTYLNYPFHPESEKIVEILSNKLNNSNKEFFRIIIPYFYGIITSHLRIKVQSFQADSPFPLNIYAINLSPSGTGKGFSTNFLENELLKGFKHKYLHFLLPTVVQSNLEYEASKRAQTNSSILEEELGELFKEYNSLGSLLFNFDSATVPAVKQMRQKLLMGGIGGINLQIDEIGANLTSQTDLLNTFIELFDLGLIKEKLIKSTKDNKRIETFEGSTPANMLLFGTPSKLLDGGKTEKEFMDMLSMGYARRCLFGYSTKLHEKEEKTPAEILQEMRDTSSNSFISSFNNKLSSLAAISNIDKVIELPQDIAIECIQYKLNCEKVANNLPETQETLKIELYNRYSKALKLAGIYAFIDGKDVVSHDHLKYAIKLVETSGLALEKLLTPLYPHMRLAHYLADVKSKVTLADLHTDLEYFKVPKSQKDEMLNMATAYGIKNNIIIKKEYQDDVLFIEAESLKPTNLEELIISTSLDITTNYSNLLVNWNNIETIAKQPNNHWINHHLNQGYRNEENAIAGFNMLVFDIDGDIPIDSFKKIFQDFKYFLYTTKSHTDEKNRYRVLFPTSHILYFDAQTYKDFIMNIYQQLPFQVDMSCNYRSKKWLTNQSSIYFYNEGNLFDILSYIPRTKRLEDRQKLLSTYENLNGLQKWFLTNMAEGNRNNSLLRYGLVLKDLGRPIDIIKLSIEEMNNNLGHNKLPINELQNTIFKTLEKK